MHPGSRQPDDEAWVKDSLKEGIIDKKSCCQERQWRAGDLRRFSKVTTGMQSGEKLDTSARGQGSVETSSYAMPGNADSFSENLGTLCRIWILK